MSSSCHCFIQLSTVIKLVVNESNNLFSLSHICIYSQLILFTDYKLVLYFLDSLCKLQSKWLVTMSVSLHTQTRLHCLTIQVLKAKVWFLDIRYAPFTSIHYNLERFSAFNLNYITSLIKVWIRRAKCAKCLAENSRCSVIDAILLLN